MNRIFATAILCVTMVSIGSAGVVTLSGEPTGTGTSYTFTEMGLMDGGLTFDVTHTITGSANVSSVNGVGLGIDGGAGDTVDPGEFLTISSVINITAGTGTVAGTYDAATFFGPAPGQIASLPSSFPSVTLTGAAGDAFFVNNFTTSYVGTTAVPEPGSFACLGAMALGLVTRRRRRSRS